MKLSVSSDQARVTSDLGSFIALPLLLNQLSVFLAPAWCSLQKVKDLELCHLGINIRVGGG